MPRTYRLPADFLDNSEIRSSFLGVEFRGRGILNDLLIVAPSILAATRGTRRRTPSKVDRFNRRTVPMQQLIAPDAVHTLCGPCKSACWCLSRCLSIPTAVEFARLTSVSSPGAQSAVSPQPHSLVFVRQWWLIARDH